MSGTTSRRALVVALQFPEAAGSAAGVRTAALVRALASSGAESVAVAAAASPTAPHQLAARADLERGGPVSTHVIRPNDDGASLGAILETVKPSLVVFDRLFAEEMFSHVVRTRVEPPPLTVLDTQDLHSLRAAREALVQADPTHADGATALRARPTAADALHLREISAMARSDVVWTVSPGERDVAARWLGECAGSSAAAAADSKVRVLSFPSERRRAMTAPRFGERRGFAFLGTFRHAPNVDALRWTMHAIWPHLRRIMSPPPQLAIYGSHAPAALVRELHRPDLGVTVTPDVPSIDVLASHRVLLAPLRFGAGIKGKILDAWACGLPVVTTPVGSEGLDPDSASWCGGLGSLVTAEDLAMRSARLHDSPDEWESASQGGRELLERLFPADAFESEVHRIVKRLSDPVAVAERRRHDVLQGVLWSAQHRATQYMSQFLSLKERLRENERATTRS